MKRRELKVITFLAYKDLVRDKKIVLLVIFLIIFSYINLTFFPAFLNGLSNTFQDEAVDTGTSHIIIQPRLESSNKYINFESSLRKKIDLISGVVGSSNHIDTQGTVEFNGKEMGGQVVGLTPSKDRLVTTIHEKILKGNFLSDNDRDQIVIGQNIAGEKIEDKIGEELAFGSAIEGLGGVDVGEKVTITYANGIEREYRVKGIVGSVGFSFVSSTIYITTEEAEDVLNLDDQASSILVRLNDREKADIYKNIIQGLGLKGAKILTWEEASSFTEGIKQTFSIVNVVTTLIGVIIVISTVSIVIFINTSRKKRIIGVLKALGIQSKMVLYVFLFESLLFGVIGAILGAAMLMGFLSYLTINPIELPIGHLTPVLPNSDVINAMTIILIVSLVGGYVPARMSSKEEIIEALKVVE